jgi:hypothetical protein
MFPNRPWTDKRQCNARMVGKQREGGIEVRMCDRGGSSAESIAYWGDQEGGNRPCLTGWAAYEEDDGVIE